MQSLRGSDFLIYFWEVTLVQLWLNMQKKLLSWQYLGHGKLLIETRMYPLGTRLLHFTQKVCGFFWMQIKQQNVWEGLKASLLTHKSLYLHFYLVLKYCDNVSRTSPNLSDLSALIVKFLWDVTSLFSFSLQLDFNYNYLHRCQKLHYQNLLALQPVTNHMSEIESIVQHFQLSFGLLFSHRDYIWNIIKDISGNGTLQLNTIFLRVLMVFHFLSLLYSLCNFLYDT